MYKDKMTKGKELLAKYGDVVKPPKRFNPDHLKPDAKLLLAEDSLEEKKMHGKNKKRYNGPMIHIYGDERDYKSRRCHKTGRFELERQNPKGFFNFVTYYDNAQDRDSLITQDIKYQKQLRIDRRRKGIEDED